ncbi:hypothetical protein EXIGLDRAFT_780358 [Exidia glandulosa HHB12029]|uniref:Uncharacterized protein n=1 Tax=Exidia glandulosa HHB12029 TaxID=1314781 RepID=A0A165BN32_EXIGL|nr:hypothetical protein EXIGLDRAFT_780358 [Exidia glandulosa HHB12029]
MANNTQAAFIITADRAAVIAAEMLVVVCGDRQAARAAVAYAFLATAGVSYVVWRSLMRLPAWANDTKGGKNTRSRMAGTGGAG